MPRWASGRTGKPDYWDEARQALAGADSVMATLSERYGPEGLVGQGNPFVTFVRSIVGQQISVRAAESIWHKLEAHVGTVDPESIAAHDEASLRSAGLTRQKARYLHALAVGFEAGELGPDFWDHPSDEATIEALCSLNGIGRWTAEMFLIFHLMRPDILPLGDIGVRRAAGTLYGDGRSMEPDRISALAERWRPWRTVATWYLWRSLDPIPVSY